MRKLIFVIFIFTLLFGVFASASAYFPSGQAQGRKVEINFFYSSTCPHCAKEEIFLKRLKKEHPEIGINKLEISAGESVDLLKKFYREYKVPSKFYGLVPATFVGDKYFIGFNKNIEKDIEDCVLRITEKDEEGPCGSNAAGSRGQAEKDSTPINLEKKINIPLLGEVDPQKYSLPVLTVILGILDGFNVCSLGALVLILGLVLALRSRKKILIFGGLYILVTSLVYGFLIILWYQIFSFFVPYMRIMRVLIGLLGIGGGIYFLKEFIRFRKKGLTCEAGAGKKLITKFSSKFQKTLKESGSIFLLIGAVLLFAAIITIVEFPCSAAVPVVYAGLLAQSHLPGLYYLLYIAFYLAFYMLDEIIIFLIALFTMKLWLASNRAMTWIVLIEAAILFVLGFYYLFNF